MSRPNVKDFFNPDGSVKEATQEEEYAEQIDKSEYASAVREGQGGKRWPGRSSRRRRRKSRRKSKRKKSRKKKRRRKSKKKKRRRKRKRTKKRRRKRRR